MKKLVIILCFLSFSSVIYAGKYDIDANRFYDKDKKQPDSAGFSSLIEELAFITSNKMYGPGKTLGLLGFDISYVLGLTNINENADYWKKAIQPNLPQDFVPSMQLNFSKGLFMSLELEGFISHIFQSSIWGIGLNVKASLLEGYKYAPEVTLFGGVDTLMGTKGYTVLSIPAGLLISKTFGLGGIIRISPYAGYRFHAIRGASEVLYTFVGDDIEEFVISPFWKFTHSAILGFTVKGGVVAFGFESLLSADIMSISFKLGLNF